MKCLYNFKVRVFENERARKFDIILRFWNSYSNLQITPQTGSKTSILKIIEKENKQIILWKIKKSINYIHPNHWNWLCNMSDPKCSKKFGNAFFLENNACI